jgi:hypothetical protein
MYNGVNIRDLDLVKDVTTFSKRCDDLHIITICAY